MPLIAIDYLRHYAFIILIFRLAFWYLLPLSFYFMTFLLSDVIYYLLIFHYLLLLSFIFINIYISHLFWYCRCHLLLIFRFALPPYHLPIFSSPLLLILLIAAALFLPLLFLLITLSLRHYYAAIFAYVITAISMMPLSFIFAMLDWLYFALMLLFFFIFSFSSLFTWFTDSLWC